MTKYKKENEEPQNTDNEGKENYKLTLGFVKSLTSKLNKSNITFTDDSEKETIKNQITALSTATNGFLEKYGLR
jgi:hypothetical protein